MSVAPSTSLPYRDLWTEALKTLNEADRCTIDVTRSDKVEILKDVYAIVKEKQQQCLQRRWKYKNRKGEEVILRDVCAKILVWVGKFKEIGDIVVQYDPTHATLPWAAVRFVLQAATNDSQTFGSMAEGVELVAELITRYTIVEHLYLRRPSHAKEQLTQALIKLYARVLTYLPKARAYYEKNTLKRAVGSLVQSSEQIVQAYVNNIKQEQVNVDACTRLVDAEVMRRVDLGINSGFAQPDDDRKKLMDFLADMDKPIRRIAIQLSELYDSLERSEREKVFRWLSSTHYTGHQNSKVRTFLPNSGRWLLAKQTYKDWRKSSVSSILWLHGIPGSGKSMLVSSVIAELQAEGLEEQQPTPLAYYYCARNVAEPERADPDELMRTILEQLSASNADTPIRDPVVKAYKTKLNESKGRPPEKLMLDETVEIILELLETNPAIIVIDALDECDALRRQDLLLALREIIQKSASLVKFFVSSRDDHDIVHRLAKIPNLYISAEDNSQDIERFIKDAVDKAIEWERILCGEVSTKLRSHIIETLTSRAQGMFRLASLHIQSLCDPQRIKTEENVMHALTILPEELNKSYDIIFQQIGDSSYPNPEIASRIMKWLLCAVRPLKTPELIAAVSVDSNGHVSSLDNTKVLSICCNTVVLDLEDNVFRIAHLSVREYLESKPEYDNLAAHTLALERCLDVFNLEQTDVDTVCHDNLSRYAIQWPTHYKKIDSYYLEKELPQKLQRFLYEVTIHRGLKEWVKASANNLLYFNLFYKVGTPLAIACILGFISIINDLLKRVGVDWEERDSGTSGITGLHLAAKYGHDEVIRSLLQNQKIYAEIGDDNGKTALHYAISAGHLSTTLALIKGGADIFASSLQAQTSLHFAAIAGSIPLVNLCLDKGVEIDAKDNNAQTALHTSYHGPASLIVLLLDKGADIEARAADGSTPLHKSCRLGGLHIINKLLNRGADIEARAADGSTPLHESCRLGGLDIINELLNRGADIEARAADGSTPLHESCWRGDLDIINKLLDRGADIEARDEDGLTPLHIATDSKDYIIICKLLNRGADIEAPAADGSTPLHKSCWLGDLDIINKLLDRGADIEARNLDGSTPLHLACDLHVVACVRPLLDRGADIEVSNNVGETPLHWAAQSGCRETVHMLLKNGANVVARTVTGQTTLEYAARVGEVEVCAILLDHCKSNNVEVPEQDLERVKWLNDRERILCNVCGKDTREVARFWLHCNLCNDGSFDICKKCCDDDEYCLDESHELVRSFDDEEEDEDEENRKAGRKEKEELYPPLIPTSLD